MGYDLRKLVAQQLSAIYKKASNKKKKVVYTIGNTRVLDDSKYYLTPVREYKEFIVAGVIVFSEFEAKIILQEIDGVVDFIFVDCEKKSKNNSHGYFNIERLSWEIVTRSNLKFYKGNDLTVESIDNFIFHYFLNINQLIGGLNILIIGVGNIGFKVALKLLERGANIFLFSADENRAQNLSNVLNDIKPKETIAKAKAYTKKYNHTILDCIVLTGLAPKEENTAYLKNNIKQESLILDVGKGCLNSDQIKLIQNISITPYRLDIGETLENKIKLELSSEFEFKLPRTINLDNDLILIEVGVVGRKGEIVVKDIDSPESFIGVCDGEGGLFNLNQNEKKNIINRIQRKLSERDHQIDY